MPRFIIERHIPDAGDMDARHLHELARRSCAVIDDMGHGVQWVHTHITDDRMYCLYIAPDARALQEHARRGGFPADRIEQVRTIIDPTTAEARHATQSRRPD